ncbi:MAG: hypothetical protein KBE04_07810 [Phycisphaerae bacterium]|nr:hypothetical protein [Phycisphaerae bacterium]
MGLKDDGVLMQTIGRTRRVAWMTAFWVLAGMCLADHPTVTPSPYWKSQISFLDYGDRFRSFSHGTGGVAWVKFTILMEPYDANLVYFQDSRRFTLHYDFASRYLDPFVGISSQEFYEKTLSSAAPPAILGTVLFPPADAGGHAAFNEYGIQLVRYDPTSPGAAFPKERIRDLFYQVAANVIAPPGLQVLFFPTFEQQGAADADRAWFESQGIRVGSVARWAQGNPCYSEGWALGRLQYCPSDRILQAYQTHELEPNDILLTDGVPAEIPVVAGVLSLSPSAPNSHVAILSRTYFTPFAHLAVQKDADLARSLVGRRILFTAYEDASGVSEVRLIDTEGRIDAALMEDILKLKEVGSLDITPMAPCGAYGVSTDGLSPSDSKCVGGKAANFGILRTSIPANSPRALALTFDLWNAFLDQPLAAGVPSLEIQPGQYLLVWADGDEDEGPTHAGFKLSADGESIALFDADGRTPIDAVHFGRQQEDVSYGRSADGGATWQEFAHPTPGRANSQALPVAGPGLVVNEFMAKNGSTLQDPCDPGQYPDWIELYNASDRPVVLNGLCLTDDMNDPTRWRVPIAVGGATLREEIAARLAPHHTYPPADGQGLSMALAQVRALFTSPAITQFRPEVEAAVLAFLTDPNTGFDPNTMLRFRSSTNVEDSDEYTGAGLYDSYSGCPADDLDVGEAGPCRCDPTESSERGVFRAIRRTFASFYNDNAYLERLHRGVDESEVGMAVLVNPSFPDELELANGVATIDTDEVTGGRRIQLVSQVGSVSVTNPEDGSIPEEFVLHADASGKLERPMPYDVLTRSSRVLLGGTVLAFRDDYVALGGLLIQVSDRFGEVTGRTSYILDVEYKKVAPGDATLPSGGLVIKQVRPVPEPNRAVAMTPFLIHTPMEFEVFTGELTVNEQTDVFAQHRLKSKWRMETHTLPLDPNTIATRGLYAKVTIEYLDEDRVRTVEDQMSLPVGHGFVGTTASDTWRWEDLANPRGVRLSTAGVCTAVSSAENPFLTLADLGTNAYTPYKVLDLDVTYDRDVVSWNQFAASSGQRRMWTNRNVVRLWACQPPDAGDLLQERDFNDMGIHIRTSFYYPAAPEAYPNWGGTTAPLKRWGQTEIEGLTTEPIVLRGYYSQTYRPEHHNLQENFLFEPRLEPGISQGILDELRAQDIRLIHMTTTWVEEGVHTAEFRTHGF